MKKYLQSASCLSLVLAAGLLVSGPAHANPEDGVVAAGSATITTTGPKLDVHQSSNQVVIDWRSFDIAPDEHTQFYQPSSSATALNRINSGDASQILGKLSANGNVIIINPSGVMFGQGSQVDVNGLVATSSDISNTNFMSGNLQFDTPGHANAKITNAGTITAKDAGLVGLVAPQVSNSGTITAKLGRVQLASGDRFTADLYGDGLMNVTLSDAVTAQIVNNSGSIEAAGGTIELTAAAGAQVVNSLVNVTGELSAPAVGLKNGKIVIAGDASTISHTGTISAEKGEVSVRGKNIANQGKVLAQDGSVNIKFKKAYLDNEQSLTQGKSISVAGDTGSHAFVSGQYDASSSTSSGGKVEITAKDGDLKLFGARVNADGKTGGGEILIGGDYQGTGTTAHSATTSVNFATTLSANATHSGNGGKVIVWSDSETKFGGKAYAKGGTTSGNGGLIELSSHETLQVASNATTDASALHGQAGSLLLDPKNIIVATGGLTGGISSFEFIDPNVDAGNFGGDVRILSTGNVFIVDSADDFSGVDSGAAYLFNGATGGLISTLTGSSAGDAVGSGPILVSNGNIILAAPDWDNGATSDAGAVISMSATTGLNGVVSTANSLYGTTAGDQIGSGYIWDVGTNNYVVVSPNWDNGGLGDVGAVTWIDGSAGLTGPVSAANSLIGATPGDMAGYDGIRTLSNGNYLVLTSPWQSGVADNVGAVTWANGATGITGVISAANSLVGSSDSDNIASYYNILEVGNSNYLVFAREWDNGAAVDAGSITWGSGTTGVSGVISAANSLIGSTSYDLDFASIEFLSNDNILIASGRWDNGAAVNAGAVTFIDTNVGKSGVIGAATSLVGTTTNDEVGSFIRTMNNGNYLVASRYWDNAAAVDAGAVTWGSGVTGVSGIISAANSLVGSTSFDYIGDLTLLTNGNYVVNSSFWDNGLVVNAGAATWGNGATGISGTISAANSLIGSNTNDYISEDGVLELTNGNYVVSSRFWANGAAFRAGAVTWGNGTTGISGAVSTANSLYGTSSFDYVGFRGAIALANGNYVAQSDSWNGVRGAITWGDGSSGTIGAVSALNSVVGSAPGERLGFYVGFSTVTTLANGDYFVASPNWDDGVTADVGAIRLLDGTAASSGAMTSANALVGSSAFDFTGYQVSDLGNGNYTVILPYWDNGGAADAGAISFVNGTTGLTGVISSANSLVGSSAGDRIGSFNNFLSSNFFIINNPFWDNGLAEDAGSVTFMDITTGVTGAISSSNSLIGSSSYDQIGNSIQRFSNGLYAVSSSYWDNGAATDAGAVTFLNGLTGYTGVVSASNSLVGSTSGDQIGSYIQELSDGTLAILSYSYDDGANADAGAVTFSDITTTLTGIINAGNSLIGPGANSGMYDHGEDTINETFIINFSNLDRVFAYSLNGGGSSLTDYDSYTDSAASTITLDPTFITNVLNAGTSVTLQANNDITVNDDIVVNNGGGNGGTLTLQAGRSIFINNYIYTDDADLYVYANEDLATGVQNAHRDAGNAVISMGTGATIDTGAGNLVFRLDDGAGKTNRGAGDISLEHVTANTITAINNNTSGDIVLNSGGSVFATASSGDSVVLASRRNFINNGGAGIFTLSGSARWLSYSTRPEQDLGGGLVADFSLYNCTYGGACGTLGSNNGFLYSFNPFAVTTPTTTVPPTVLYVSQTPPENIIYVPSQTGTSIAVSVQDYLATPPEQIDASVTYSLFNGWIIIDPVLVKKLNLLWSQL